MKISNVKPLEVTKITDLIEPRTLELILKRFVVAILRICPQNRRISKLVRI